MHLDRGIRVAMRIKVAGISVCPSETWSVAVLLLSLAEVKRLLFSLSMDRWRIGISYNQVLL